MDWMQYTILTTTEASELISQVLLDAGSTGTMIEDKNDVAANQRPEGQWDIIDEAIARRIGDDVKVTGYFEVDGSLPDRIAHIQSELRRLSKMDLGMDKHPKQLASIYFSRREKKKAGEAPAEFEAASLNLQFNMLIHYRTW